MVMIVLGITRACDRIVAMRAGCATGDAARIAPDVGSEIGMGIVNSCINHADDDGGGTGGNCPSRLRSDIGACLACLAQDRLTDIAQPPLFGIQRVVRSTQGMNDVIRLGISHVGFALILLDGLLHRATRSKFDDASMDVGKITNPLVTMARLDLVFRQVIGTGFVPNDQLTARIRWGASLSKSTRHSHRGDQD